jgi:Ca-activated chloride channel family protein
MPSPFRRRRWVAVGSIAVTGLLISACQSSSGDSDGAGRDADRAGCVTVDMTVHPRKIDLLVELVEDFNESGVAVEGRCVVVRPQQMSSGAATDALASGWDEATDGPRPVVWAPAASTWGAVLNQRLAERGQPPMATSGEPFMVTPLVIAMPEPMARALGWPDTPIGWADLFALATSPTGWAARGHPEWGAFKLGKTNPHFSTSGLATLIAQAYAATAKTEGWRPRT